MATTTNYGWTTPDNTAYVKDGASAIRSLGSSIDTTSATTNLAGLVLIKTQTIGSGVSSVTVTGAFSATYDAYRIVFSGVTGNSAAAGCTFALGSTTTGYYATQTEAGGYSSSGNVTYTSTSNTASIPVPLIIGNGSGMWTGGHIEVQNPFGAVLTTVEYVGSDPRTSGHGLRTGSGFQNSTTSFTAFTFAPGSSTFGGGLIAVYGYRKAI